jgi:predicted Zn-dependent peptidase
VVGVVAVAAAAAVVAEATARVPPEPTHPPGDGSDPSPGAGLRRSVLPGGLRIVTESVPTALSVALSVWVEVGGRDESDAEAGTSHVLEHLLFKGTEGRNALDVAIAVDAVGGDMNAFTANEHTTFYARVPAEAFDVGVDVLLDVVAAPALRAADLDGEKGVILEELAAAEDDPEDVCAVRLYESLFVGHPLGREVLGNETTIRSLARDDVESFFRTWYRPANLVVAAAGLLDHDRLVEEVSTRFGGLDPGAAPHRTAPGPDLVAEVVEERGIESAHLAVAWRGLSATDDDRFALSILNHVFGAGPSSRLFQEVRERRGLAYAICSGLSPHVDAGALSVQGAASPDHIDEVRAVVTGLAEELATDGITADELARAKGALRGGAQLSCEDPSSRMMRLGLAESLRGCATPLTQQLDRIDAVTVDDVRRVAARVFSAPHVVSTVVPD